MFKIMPEHKLQRNGSQINMVPKWHEFIKKWDLYLEEPPSLLTCSGSPSLTHPSAPGTGAAQSVARVGLMEGENIKLHGSVFKWHYNQDKKSS